MVGRVVCKLWTILSLIVIQIQIRTRQSGPRPRTRRLGRWRWRRWQLFEQLRRTRSAQLHVQIPDALRTGVLLRREGLFDADHLSTSHQSHRRNTLQSGISTSRLRIRHSALYGAVRSAWTELLSPRLHAIFFVLQVFEIPLSVVLLEAAVEWLSTVSTAGDW